MADVELLPLPEGWRIIRHGHYAESKRQYARAMYEYARANVSHATAPLQAEIEELRAEVVKLRNLRADAIHECALANVRAERLAEALREMREYVTAALQDQREAFAGHEDCSDIVGIEADLHKIDALLRDQEQGRDKDHAHQPPSAPVGVEELVRDLVSEIERNTCAHEDTHRGGAIWEICNACGEKWADDRGGKPDFKWPDCVERARAWLAHQPAAVDGACAVAAIRFALTDPEGMTFLRLWNEGEFDTLRREWPEAPVEVYVGADSLARNRE